MHTTWESLAKNSVDPGHAAFARRQSYFYLKLHHDAESWFAWKGEERFVKTQDSTIVQTVRSFRQQELAWLEALAKVNGS